MTKVTQAEGRPHRKCRSEPGLLAGGAQGGASDHGEDWTVDDLQERAKELGLHGYSHKKKDELIDMLRNH